MSRVNCETEVCRLCGTVNGIFMNIFESSPNNECIVKIEAVVPHIVILREDSLSKSICHRCVAKVKDFYDFQRTCVNTQEILRSRIPWLSSSPKTAPLRVVSPMIQFIGGPLAYPFGETEKEVEVLTLSDDEDGVGKSPQPSEQRQPQVRRSLGVNGLSSPRLQDSRSQPSPSFSRQSMDSVRNEKAASGKSTQKSVVHNLAAAGSYEPSTSRLKNSPSRATPNARMGSSIGRGKMPLPSQSFRSFVQLNQVAAVNQPGHQFYSDNMSEPSVLPAAKRTCRQSPSVSPKMSESDNLSLNRRSLITSSTPSTAVTLSALSSPSSSFVARPASSTENSLNDVLSLPAAVTVSVPRPSENAPSCENSISAEHRLSGAIMNSDNKTKNSTVQPAKPKPKPRSKKKPIDLTEAEINNIRNKYPSVESVKICGNTIIFTCTKCNKMLLTEEAICIHACLSSESDSEVIEAKDNDHSNSSQNKNGLVLTQSKESSHSTYVELSSSSDDETSNDALERHMCTICGNMFHSSARLQKHLQTH